MLPQPDQPLAEVALHKVLGVINVGRRAEEFSGRKVAAATILGLVAWRGRQGGQRGGRLDGRAGRQRPPQRAFRVEGSHGQRTRLRRLAGRRRTGEQAGLAGGGTPARCQPPRRRKSCLNTCGPPGKPRHAPTIARLSQASLPPNRFQMPPSPWCVAQRWFSTASPSTLIPRACSVRTQLQTGGWGGRGETEVQGWGLGGGWRSRGGAALYQSSD